jgi:hypothetical protein
MFNIPMKNPATMGKGFGRKDWVGFRMSYAIMINSKRLTADMGNAEYLHILLHILKNFHLSRAPINETPITRKKTFYLLNLVCLGKLPIIQQRNPRFLPR